ncbi:Aste57867_10076 [Aphanomyces stellatus]|uniref:Aste57867_10076 protein n=1 Tax=Aphanomyces stellatus TaxID=120398 RepID=A0A485KPX3_9STRA|nr:hypothetical protein As57867_010037 [Aphanomyces stellatus]VFT86952.1 Aste57867_10076 [Aphanomyces stellatus]
MQSSIFHMREGESLIWIGCAMLPRAAVGRLCVAFRRVPPGSYTYQPINSLQSHDADEVQRLIGSKAPITIETQVSLSNNIQPASARALPRRPTPLEHFESSMGCHAELIEMPPPTTAIDSTVGPSSPKVALPSTHDDDATSSEPHAAAPAQSPSSNRFFLLAFCFTGVMASFTINGMALEAVTSVHAISETSLTFLTSLVFAVFAVALKRIVRERPSTLPLPHYLFLSLLAFISTLASVWALRYVTFITRVLGKSCKSIPVMLVGVCFGKRYTAVKYLSVGLLSVGVAVFLLGTHYKQEHYSEQTTTAQAVANANAASDLVLGVALLLVSLVCDGATGALEDKYMLEYTVGAFELMFQLNRFKALFACAGMLWLGELSAPAAAATLHSPAFLPLVALSVSGAAGQAFIFFTISQFGALTTSIMGTMRKVVSIALSVALFHHVLGNAQVVGLGLSFGAIMLNWVRCRPEQKSDGVEDVELCLLADDKHGVDADVAATCDEDTAQQHEKARQVLSEWERTTGTFSSSKGVQQGIAAV